MKPPLNLRRRFHPSKRGIALISVLAMVMLLTALVVAFMLRVGSEKQASGFYRAESTTRSLSDTVLNIVEGEINEATTQGITYSWASQPGAIRVFDNTGAAYKIFKLYSSNSMAWLGTSGMTVKTFLQTKDLPPATWYSSPGTWVDLNAPVNTDSNPNPTTQLGNPSYTHFPILDPRDPTDSTKTIAMDGFSITTASTPYDVAKIDTNGVNPAPMPVQWIYLLQNGTTTTPTGTDASGNYTFATAPSASNPIIGRMAFWTDDETSKVNVNTAGADGIMGKTANSDRADPSAIAQGTFWSPPYFAAPDETGPGPINGPYTAGFCTAQPVSGEYQRYPGHPATVALSNILNTLRPSSGTPYINTSTFYAASTTTPGITPRYVYGGTQENTTNTFGTGTYGANANLSVNSVLTASFRLYPTLSEALFSPSRTNTNINTTDAASRQRMETGRFFLTAHSRAPELNLFGLPRVSIWPMAYNASLRTAVDNLIGFCSTIGGTQGNTTNGSAYYFTRSSCGDSTVDIGLTDTSSNHRNALLLNYLDYVTKQNIPGFGGSFYTKDYGSGTGLTGQNDQILAEIFDYVRSTNIQDGTSAQPYNGAAASNPGGVNYISSNGGWWGVGQVAPSLINTTTSGGILSWNNQGNSSFPRLIEATIQFVALGQGGNPGDPSANPAIPPTNAIPINPAVVSACFPSPALPTTTAVNYPYPTAGSTTSGPPAYGPPPSLNPANASYNPPAYNAFASANPMGFILGYPVTPQIAQGDVDTAIVNGSPVYNGLTYAWNKPFPATPTKPNPTASLPYAPPGAIDSNPPGTAYPNPTTIYPAPPATGPYNTIYRVHNYLTGLDSGIPPDGTTAVQAFILLTFLNPAEDWVYCSPCVWVSISGLNSFQLNGHSLSFPDPDCAMYASGQDWHGGGRSGYVPIDCNFQGKTIAMRTPGQVNSHVGNWPFGFPFFSSIIPIRANPAGGSFMQFTGGPLTIKLYDAPWNYVGGIPQANNAAAPTNGHLVQTYNITFPSTGQNGMPVPILTPNPLPIAKDLATYMANTDTTYPPMSAFSIPQGSSISHYTAPKNGWPVAWVPWINPDEAYGTFNAATNDFNVTAMEETGPIVGLGGPSSPLPVPPAPLPPVIDSISSTSPQGQQEYAPYYYRWNQPGQFIPVADQDEIDSGDTVESMVLSKAWSDPRLLAVATVPSTAWVTHPNWGTTAHFAHNLFWGMVLPAPGNGNNPWNGEMWVNNAWAPSAWTGATPNTSMGTLAGNVVDPQPFSVGGLWATFPWAPCVFGDNKAPTTVSGAPPDWDSGLSPGSDGPWTNKADEGSGTYQSNMPYYGNPVGQPPAQFSANREVCSPGMLGSLPTGVDTSGVKPAGWQTLLFRPGPGAAGYTTMVHPGEGIPVTAGTYSPPYTTPPDHLWMDLFWIPITEPYAISEPMSTAGKINLNYQIVPFTYIKRATALRAALATEKIAQVGLNQSPTCKGAGQNWGLSLNGPFQIYTTGASTEVNAHYPIDLDVTLSQFDKKFNSFDLFRSASQICENFLVPMDIPNNLPNGTSAPATPAATGEIITPTGNYPLPTTSGDTTGVLKFAKDWYTPVTTPQTAATYTTAPFAMIGDNLREQPYAHLYGKLTTKSNTYTVYYRVQALKEPASVLAAGKWSETLGAVSGEYRGSTTIERFIDPNEKTSSGTNVVPDAALQVGSGATPTSLEGYYKWRVVENHQFAP